MTESCDARRAGDPWPTLHTCNDPLACGLDRLISGDDPTEAELERLHAVLDDIEDLTHGRKTLRSEAVLKLIHDERGGPR